MKIYCTWLFATLMFALGLPANGAEVSGSDSTYGHVWWTDPPHTHAVKGLVATNSEGAPPQIPHAHEKTSLCTPSSRCDKMTLMYSEDDVVCKPLLKIYQKYWGKQKGHSTILDRVWWENSQPDLFAEAGFVTPMPLQDELHVYIPTASSMSGDNLAIVHYRLKLDPSVETQTVLLQDLPYRSHGYHSDVYISEPGEDISTKSCGTPSTQTASTVPRRAEKKCLGYGFPSNHLAFATYFFDYGEPDEIHADTLISHEYVFEKNNTYKKYARVYDGEILSAAVGISDEIIQRIYLFHGHPIFIARDSEDILAYRIKDSSEMDDVCHIASNVAKINP